MGTRIQKVYGVGGPLLNLFPTPIIADRAPTSTDTNYPQGQTWWDNSPAAPEEYTFDGISAWLQGGNTHATTTEFGIVILNDSVTMAGATDDQVPTALAIKTYADNLAIAGAPIAQTGVTGITNLSTDAQAVAGTATVPGVTALAVQPSNLAAVFASPPAIGGTSPLGGAFTTLTSNNTTTITNTTRLLTPL